jgi:hypothetical protein
LEVFRPAFHPATFARWALLSLAWLCCRERFAITECLVVARLAGLHDHAAFHRVFSRRRWDLDALGRLLALAVLARLRAAGLRLTVVVDDTLAPHKGPRVFGLGNHLDAVRSTRKTKVFAFGHVWVVLAVVVDVPFAPRPWALPVLFRLYRTRAACQAAGVPYRKKTELAAELLAALLAWVPEGPLDVLLDRGYANRTVLPALPARVRVFAAVAPNAAFCALDDPRVTRPRARRGVAASLTPEGVRDGESVPRAAVTADVYGGARTFTAQSLTACWFGVLPGRAVRVVVVHVAHGAVSLRAFVCTDPSAEAAEVLGAYARRWAIEVFFFEAKQYLGLAASRARHAAAVTRMAPWTGLLYGVLALWFAEAWERGVRPVLPTRPWYGHKRGVSFEDLLRTARAALDGRDLVALVAHVTPLRRPRRTHDPARYAWRRAA